MKVRLCARAGEQQAWLSAHLPAMEMAACGHVEQDAADGVHVCFIRQHRRQEQDLGGTARAPRQSGCNLRLLRLGGCAAGGRNRGRCGGGKRRERAAADVHQAQLRAGGGFEEDAVRTEVAVDDATAVHVCSALEELQAHTAVTRHAWPAIYISTADAWTPRTSQ